jgi:hypothetical protein
MTTLHETTPGKKLKVFLVEEDEGDHESLYMTILRLLHDAGIAGATVFRGTEGFGERRVIHTAKLEVMSFSLPITIEASDMPEKIDAIAPRVAEILTSGLVEVSRTFILRPGSVHSPLQGGNAC